MEKIYYASFYSHLKNVFVASTTKGLCMVDFLTSEKAFLRIKEPYGGDHPGALKNGKALSQIKRYLMGKLKRFDRSLDLREHR